MYYSSSVGTKQKKENFIQRTVSAYKSPVFKPNGLRLRVHQGLCFVLLGLAILLTLSDKQFNSDFCSGFRIVGGRYFFVFTYFSAFLIGIWGIETKRWLVRFLSSVAVGTVHWMSSCLFILSGQPTMSIIVFCFPAFLAWRLAWDYRLLPAHYRELLNDK